jgi:methylenetetrahydrofolate reductase (NADPH)
VSATPFRFDACDAPSLGGTEVIQHRDCELQRMTPRLSFEFFPPKTDEQIEQLDKTVEKLRPLSPHFFSVTFGAGGSTLSQTPRTVKRLRDGDGTDVAPHLSCVGGSREEIRALLDEYRAMGCRHLVALRGDLPSGMAAPGDLRYASELVEFVRAETGDYFHIEVGCYPEMHPQASDLSTDLQHLKRKFDVGANGAITQYFFNPDAYFRFCDEARRIGITQPIVPGIMPISNYSQLKRFSDLCGAEIPRWIAKRLEGYRDDAESIREFGADVVAQLCRRLVEGGVGELHFYTLNRAKATLSVIERL